MIPFKALFIDRDGTILREPEDEQVDSLAKLRFVPGVIGALKSLRALPFRMVLASNQDGLGTPAFPEEDFLAPHNMMKEILAGEGVEFDDELIDPSFEEDNAPTRKPRTGMFGAYMDGSCDLADSYVIGDRLSDVQLAANLGARAILLASPEVAAKMLAGSALSVALASYSWEEIADFIRRGERVREVVRSTRETSIRVLADLDARTPSSILPA